MNFHCILHFPVEAAEKATAETLRGCPRKNG